MFRPDPTDLPLLERTLGWADRAAGERLRADLPAFHFYLRAMVDGRWAPPVLVDARGAFPTPSGESEEEDGEEGDLAFLRAMVAAAHPEDYIAVEEAIRHEQVNAMRLLTPDLRAALEQLDLMEGEGGGMGRPASLRQELGL
ncbi:MAG: hypothetical protein RMM07_11900 [Anaerolineae bacterium]|nr:hypothetical protein [Anaerolineae bacterium]